MNSNRTSHPFIMYRLLLSIITLLATASSCMGFAPVHSSSAVKTLVSSTTHNNNLHALPIDIIDVVNNIGDMSTTSPDAAAIGMLASSSSMLLSETEAWVQPLSFVLGKVRVCVVLFCVMVCLILRTLGHSNTSFELSLPL